MRALCLAVLAATGFAAGTPASETGTLTVDTKKVTLQSSSAVAYPGGTGRFVSVLLSDKPPNPKTFRKYTRIGAGERYVPGTFEGAWASMHVEKGFSGFTFSMDATHRVLTNQILLGGQAGSFSLSSDDLVVEITSASPRLKGRIRTLQPVLDLGSHKVSLDATFDVRVSEAGR
ncbi:MAG: hypothetical protein ABIS27_03285 [Longimicrobiales bacterium]